MTALQINAVSTSAADGGGSEGLITTYTPSGVVESGYNYGLADGFIEMGAGTPGSLPFRVDEHGNVTAVDITATSVTANITATDITATSITATTVNGVSTPSPGPQLAGYSAWSYDPVQSLAAGISISTTTFAALVYVPASFTCSHVDVYQVSGTPNVTVGLWPATAPAGSANPLAFSAATAASAAAVNTYTFNGSSSPSSVALTGGDYYLVTVYGSTTGVAGCMTSTANGANANTLSWSVSTTYRCATVGTIAGTLATSSTFGTSTLSGDLVWVGLH